MSKLARPNILSLQRYQPGKPIEEVKRELGLSQVIKLASNENPLGPSPRVKQAIENFLPNIQYYPDGSCYRLKQALAQFYNITHDSIFITNGSNEIVQQISLAFLEPGDEVIMPVPSFPRYEPLTRLMNAVPIEVPLNNFRVDLDTMASRITSKTKVIYVCNPNNPTGTIVTKEQLDAFLRQVPENILVVLDEAYYEYVEDGAFPNGLDYLKQGRNVIVLRTFSKIYGLAGLRIGYALAPPDIVNCLERVREPFNVNAVAQEAALAALADQDWVRKVRELNAQGKAYLYQEFTKIQVPYIPTEANFILFDAGKDERLVFQQCLQKGVIIRGGLGYQTRLRVTIGTGEQNKTFIHTLREILGR
ncbi:MAG: histidinol-phosphate transaminase [Peptococcaceae bacterium]|nr:histidinol-phosphate transaminase [Peptococcaceae bacterium]